MTAPTPQDEHNAAIRAEISARFRRDWDECAAHAERLFGPGWRPSHRHFLVDKDAEEVARRTGTRPVAAATVYTVRRGDERRHFMLRDGEPVEVESKEAGFGDMLYEPHPTQGFTDQTGQFHHFHRYSLCWSGYEIYEPRTAAQLAEARARREERAVEALAEAQPLFADEIRETQAKAEPRAR